MTSNHNQSALTAIAERPLWLPRAPITENRRRATASLIFFELAIAARTGMELSAAARAIYHRTAITSHRTSTLGLFGFLEFVFLKLIFRLFALFVLLGLPSLGLVLIAIFHTFNPRVHMMTVAGQLSDFLAQGLPLHEAMAQMPRDFSPEECLLVQVATETNRLPQTLEQLGQPQLPDLWNGQNSKPLLFLIFQGLTIAAIIGFLMLFIIPKFEDIYHQLDGRLSPSLQIVIAVTSVIMNSMIFPLILALILTWIYRTVASGGWVFLIAYALSFQAIVTLLLNFIAGSFYLIIHLLFSPAPTNPITISYTVQTGLFYPTSSPEESLQIFLLSWSTLVLAHILYEIFSGKTPRHQKSPHRGYFLSFLAFCALFLILGLFVPNFGLVPWIPLAALLLAALSFSLRRSLSKSTLENVLSHWWRLIISRLTKTSTQELQLLNVFGIAIHHQFPEDRILSLLQQYGRSGWSYPIQRLIKLHHEGTPLRLAMISSGLFSGYQLAHLQAIPSDHQLGIRILNAVDDILLTQKYHFQRKKLQLQLGIYAFLGSVTYFFLYQLYNAMTILSSLS